MIFAGHQTVTRLAGTLGQHGGAMATYLVERQSGGKEAEEEEEEEYY